MGNMISTQKEKAMVAQIQTATTKKTAKSRRWNGESATITANARQNYWALNWWCTTNMRTAYSLRENMSLFWRKSMTTRIMTKNPMQCKRRMPRGKTLLLTKKTWYIKLITLSIYFWWIKFDFFFSLFIHNLRCLPTHPRWSSGCPGRQSPWTALLRGHAHLCHGTATATPPMVILAMKTAILICVATVQGFLVSRPRSASPRPRPRPRPLARRPRGLCTTFCTITILVNKLRPAKIFTAHGARWTA